MSIFLVTTGKESELSLKSRSLRSKEILKETYLRVTLGGLKEIYRASEKCRRNWESSRGEQLLELDDFSLCLVSFSIFS